jgi:hypothetical protein
MAYSRALWARKSRENRYGRVIIVSRNRAKVVHHQINANKARPCNHRSRYREYHRPRLSVAAISGVRVSAVYERRSNYMRGGASNTSRHGQSAAVRR